MLTLLLFMQGQYLARVPNSAFPSKKEATFHPHPEDRMLLVSKKQHSCSTRAGKLGIRVTVRQAGTSLTDPWHPNKESQHSWWQQQGSAVAQRQPSLTIETTQAQGQARKLYQPGKHSISKVRGQGWAYLPHSSGKGLSLNSAPKPRDRDPQ